VRLFIPLKVYFRNNIPLAVVDSEMAEGSPLRWYLKCHISFVMAVGMFPLSTSLAYLKMVTLDAATTRMSNLSITQRHFYEL